MRKPKKIEGQIEIEGLEQARAYRYKLADELIIDNFAGGGGASTGIELATGRIVDIAVNHDRAAIEMHEKNHPYTKHFCEDVWEIDPRKVTQGRPVALVWCSPDCKHFSKAKGGAPVSKHIRGLAWVAVRWAATVHPRVIILENVEEFMTWGPIKDGKPIKEKSGRTFNSFVNALKRQGYEVDWKVLKASDYGAPTSRKRFFLIARCDGQPIVFPKPTHGKGKGLKKERAAAECIDFTNLGKSIFCRKKPLAVNTMKRIAKGLDKFVIKSPKPFMMQMNFENPPQDIYEPLSTITAVNKHYIANPKISPYIMSNNTGNAPHSIDSPIPTVTTGVRNYLCASSLVQYHGEQREKEVRGQKVDNPLSTIDTSNRYGISSAFLSKYFSGENQAGADLQAPMPTVTAIDHNALLAVNISSRFGNGEDGRGRSLEEPLPTVTSEDHNQLMGSYLIKYYSGEEQYQKVENPLHTITTEPRFYLVLPHICTLRNNMIGQSLKDPLSTITAKEHHAVVSAYLTKLTGKETNLGYWTEIREMLNKYAGYKIAKDEILIIEVDNVQYFISDISMRMLEPRELAKAQGFPDDYVLQATNSYSKSAQIARIGNSVCPVMSEVLVRANLPELCGKKIKTMEQLDKILTA